MNSYKYSELNIGHTESFETTITEEMLQTFTRLSGDSNPMHNDDEYAKTNGFVSKLVCGMLTSSFYSQLVGVHLPGEFCLLQEIDIKFPNPVYCGDTLEVSGTVVEKIDVFKRIVIKAKITNSKGSIVSRAVIKVGVLDEK